VFGSGFNTIFCGGVFVAGIFTGENFDVVLIYIIKIK
jgi:hypothetical protein